MGVGTARTVPATWPRASTTALLRSSSSSLLVAYSLRETVTALASAASRARRVRWGPEMQKQKGTMNGGEL